MKKSVFGRGISLFLAFAMVFGMLSFVTPAVSAQSYSPVGGWKAGHNSAEEAKIEVKKADPADVKKDGVIGDGEYERLVVDQTEDNTPLHVLYITNDNLQDGLDMLATIEFWFSWDEVHGFNFAIVGHPAVIRQVLDVSVDHYTPGDDFANNTAFILNMLTENGVAGTIDEDGWAHGSMDPKNYCVYYALAKRTDTGSYLEGHYHRDTLGLSGDYDPFAGVDYIITYTADTATIEWSVPFSEISRGNIGAGSSIYACFTMTSGNAGPDDEMYADTYGIGLGDKCFMVDAKVDKMGVYPEFVLSPETVSGHTSPGGGTSESLEDIIYEKYEELMCISHSKLDLVFGTSGTLDSLPEVLTDIFGYQATMTEDEIRLVKDEYGGLGNGQIAWPTDVEVTFTDPATGESCEVYLDLSLYKCVTGKYSGAITDKGFLGVCPEDWPSDGLTGLRAIATKSQLFGDPGLLDNPEVFELPGEEFTAAAIEAWYRDLTKLGSDWSFYCEEPDASKAYSGQCVSLALVNHNVNDEGRTAMVSCSPTLKLEAPDPLSDIIDEKYDELCCIAHTKLDLVFGTTSATLDSLPEVLSDIFGYPATMEADELQYVKEDYGQLGDGMTSWPATVTVTFTNPATGETYDKDMDLALYKAVGGKYCGAIEDKGFLGCCPDDWPSEIMAAKRSVMDNTDVTAPDFWGSEDVIEIPAAVYTPGTIEAWLRDVTKLGSGWDFYINGYDASLAYTGDEVNIGLIAHNVNDEGRTVFIGCYPTLKLIGQHEHVPVKVEEKAATCTEDGNIGYWKCSVCGILYSDEKCSNEIEAGSVRIAALGHSFGEWTEAVAPTCTEKGIEERVCTRCGENETREIEVLVHDYVDIVTAPTCTAKGYTTHICTHCGNVYADTIVDALGHTFGEWTETTVPTCTGKGTEERVCTRCGEKEIRETDTLGHDYTDTVITPTCVAKGYTMHTCVRCGDVYADTFVDALGHDYVDSVIEPTCTAKGYTMHTCVRCGDVYADAFVDASDHDYVETVTAPSCTVQGYSTYICTRCGESYVDSYVDALGHDYAEAVTAPTCTEQGYTTHTCSRCGEAYDDSFVDALGHSPAAAVHENEKAATCTVDGSYDEVVYCTVCGAELSRETNTVAALGHDFGVDGNAEKCSVCGEKNPNYKPPVNFKDVKADAYYADAVAWAVAKGITTGTSATTFSPDEGCTRGQVVTFLWRAAGSPEPAGTKNPFRDVKSGDYFYEAVLWAVENGITTGTSTTTFSPDEVCTRGQIVTFQWRANGSPEPTNSKNPFSDVKSGDYFYRAVLWAVEREITLGTDANHFSPSDTCTRGQVVTFLYRDMA
ncbi:MAG: S-layer homology domain-containing protein [Clostridia bacterium]|nr:S-layer homology domain-containing protein [Clostridia bacterium]